MPAVYTFEVEQVRRCKVRAGDAAEAAAEAKKILNGEVPPHSPYYKVEETDLRIKKEF